MWAESDQLAAMIERAWAAAESISRGEVLSWESLEAAMGCGRNTSAGKTTVRKLKKRLLREREIVVWADTNVGLRFLTHRETAELQPMRRQRRASRQLHWAIVECGTVDPQQLSMHGQVLLAAQIKAMREERRTIRKSIRSAVGKAQALPRRAMNR